MALITRRDALQVGLGALAGTTMLGSRSLRAEIAVTDVAPPKFDLEAGASLRVLRPSKFVQGDETLFLENSKKFADQYGIPVTVTSESWEDLRPKTATAAAIGSGPDIVYAWSDDPHKFSSQCVDLTDLADYLGQKYGGWWPIVEKYGKDQKTGRWIAMPIGGSGNRFVHRKSWVNEAGYETVPEDLDGFLAMARKLKANGHPIGLALGNATGDANSWCHWLMWTHGGSLTDENDQITINSKETIEALKYGKALAETFIPGATSWLDPSNNKAFLAGEISGTGNGISIYYSAKTSKEPALQAMAADIYHARMPIGPAGTADRARPDRQPDDLQAQQVPERRQGIYAVHDGGAAISAMAHRVHRLLEPPAQGLRRGTHLDRRPQAHLLPARPLRRDLGRLQGQRRRGLGGGDRGLCRGADGGLGRHRAGHARGSGGRGGATRQALLQVLRLDRGRRHGRRRPRAHSASRRRAWQRRLKSSIFPGGRPAGSAGCSTASHS